MCVCLCVCVCARAIDVPARSIFRSRQFGKLLTKADFELAVAISKVRTRDDNPVQPIKMLSVTVRNLKTARADEAATDEAESPTKKQKSPA